MGYNCKFMDETKMKEIEELLASEHGNTLVAWSLECAKAGADVCRNGLVRNGLICAAGAGLAAGGYWVAKKIVDKRVAKRLGTEKKKT